MYLYLVITGPCVEAVNNEVEKVIVYGGGMR